MQALFKRSVGQRRRRFTKKKFIRSIQKGGMDASPGLWKKVHDLHKPVKGKSSACGETEIAKKERTATGEENGGGETQAAS